MPPKDPKRKKEYNDAWRHANPDKVREQQRRWHAAHPEYLPNYRATHKEEKRVYNAWWHKTYRARGLRVRA